MRALENLPYWLTFELPCAARGVGKMKEAVRDVINAMAFHPSDRNFLLGVTAEVAMEVDGFIRSLLPRYPMRHGFLPVPELMGLFEQKRPDLRAGQLLLPAVASTFELPAASEGWVVVPYWGSIAPTYSAAVEWVVKLLEEDDRDISWRVYIDLDEKRADLASTCSVEEIHRVQGGDYVVFPAQFGARDHASAGLEFPMGLFESLALLWAHPFRLRRRGDLDMYCPSEHVNISIRGGVLTIESCQKPYLKLGSETVPTGWMWLGSK